MQRLLRATGRIRRRGGRAARYGYAPGYRGRISGHSSGVEEGSAAVRVRAGRGGGVAVPDGEGGRYGRE